ncbi:MAG TPA: hypothetical protein VGK29_07315 [Paludibaculum sp.]
MTPILNLTLLSLITLGVLLWMYRQLALPRAWQTDLESWWKEFTPGRYDAMARLLATNDQQFLRTLPGFRPGMDQRLRRQRIQVFEAYLRELSMDFYRLHALGSELALASMAPQLHDELFRQRVRFGRAMWRIRLELIAYRLGVGEVDPSVVVDSLRITNRLFQPVLAGAAI